LGTTVKINQLDEDFTGHDILSSYTGSIPFDLGLREIKGNQSHLELSIHDTEQSPYTTGTSTPSTISPTIIGVAIAGAIVYGAGELAYSGLKNSMSSSNSYPSGSYSSSNSSSSTSESATSSTPCYTMTAKKTCGWSSEQCYETVYYDNTKKIECPVSILKCSNGTSKEIYYLPIDAGMFTPKGYYKNIAGPDERIGDTLDEAIKKVCGCN
jgi:hypothetical protein